MQQLLALHMASAAMPPHVLQYMGLLPGGVDVDITGYDDGSNVTGEDVLELLLQLTEVRSDSDLRLCREPTEVRRKRDRKFACPKCPMAFSNRGSLVGHFRKHTGERPFECETCHKRFTRNEELTRHTRIHTGDRPFGCEICCGKRFGRKDHLNKHQRTHTAPLYAAVAPGLAGLTPLELTAYLRGGMFAAPFF
ncbi:zinc finger and BTB domain-containing protein 7B-like [Pollicipes pollicipes]|uniref:zinc finger and BTB domain-containing protein 7B-like n=1 Tax=Pollicipes pollicipes TaxID=41117 RepID=UPI001885A090|nr:zinc finger and BTB domain-containing protein 7B-like [Pollicipes pollicipes]